MNRNFFRFLLSAVLMMCCTVSTWAGLGTPPDDEIWYTSYDGKVIAPYYDNVFGASIKSNTYNDGKGVIKFNGPVTKVGDWAFYKTYLTSMSLPNSVKSIGYRAFYWMNYMKEISLGNSVEKISNDAFRECDGLVTIAIPASVTSIGENAFYDCNVLKFVAIGRGVTNIGKYTFYNCNELKSVAIDGNGVTLGYEAFYDCEKLESVSFLADTPPSSFGEYCFYGCSPNLKYHVLEEYYGRYSSIGALSGNVVKGPPHNEIWYTTNNGGTAGYTSVWGTPPPLNAYLGNHGVQFFDGNPPNLADNSICFKGCTNLVSVVLPSSITSIGPDAFRGCTSLVSVSIPNSVTGIGERAFESCTSLLTITIPEKVNEIGNSAFLECTALRTVTILGSLNNIGVLAFGFCDKLFDIFYLGTTKPDCVTETDSESFKFCPATIYAKEVTKDIGDNWGGRPVRSWRSGKGDGSREKPLEIENYINLYGFAIEVSIMGSKDLRGKLMRDIVGNSNVLDANGNLRSGPFMEWLPIGSSDNVFCGEFNGNGHTISGLYHNHYDPNSCVGLFGRTGDAAYIHNFGLVDSYMSGGGLNGGICGDLAYGIIFKCYNAATVAWGGGIAGWCREHAHITDCYNVGHIFSNGSGIVDAVFKNPTVTYSVENCYALEGVSRSAINNINGSKIDKVEVKSAAAFTGGEVCKLLNDGNAGTLIWFHKSSSGSNPTFSGDYVGNYAEGYGYQIQTLCTVSTNRLHDLKEATVYKCDDSPYIYWLCSKCELNFKNIDKTLPESDANMSPHFLEYVNDAYIPTATSTGRYSHWHCTHCNDDFIDERCTIPATEESLTVPVAKNNEIWYRTSDNLKLIPYNTNAFGVTYSDAGSVYKYGLGVIRFGGNVTSIGEDAFFRRGGLTSITIPESVTRIGTDAFDLCMNLTSIVFQSLPSVERRAFIYCPLNAKSLFLTDSVKPFIGTSLANYPGGFTEARYHRTLEKDKWGTIVLPFKPSAESTTGLKFYVLQSMTTGGKDGSTLTFTEVDAPEAGMPYLVKNVSDSKTDFTLMAEKPSIILETQEVGLDNLKMKGSFQQKQLDGATNQNLYYLKDDEFLHATDKINIAPFRAYIEGDGTVQAKSFMLIIEEGEVDAIPGILTDGNIDETEAVYDLNGRRLTTPMKGQVNIIRTKSGKKVKRMF